MAEYKLNAAEVLGSVPFEKVRTPAGEDMGLYRIETAIGGMDLVDLGPDTVYTAHAHEGCDTEIHVIAGRGKLIHSPTSVPISHDYKPGGIFYATSGMYHEFRTKDRTVLLSIQSRPIRDPETGELDYVYPPKKASE